MHKIFSAKQAVPPELWNDKAEPIYIDMTTEACLSSLIMFASGAPFYIKQSIHMSSSKYRALVLASTASSIDFVKVFAYHSQIL